MKGYKCYKCSKCGESNLYPLSRLPKQDKYEICFNCGEKAFMKRDRIGGLLFLFVEFVDFVFRIFRKIGYFIKDFGPIFAIVAGLFMFFGGLIYTVVSFNKHSCERIHELTGYEINFDFYGGCFIKKNGEWLSYDKYMNVNVIK